MDTLSKCIRELLYVKVNAETKSQLFQINSVMMETIEMETDVIKIVKFNQILLALSLNPVNALFTITSQNLSTITHFESKVKTDVGFHFLLLPLIHSSHWLIGQST